MARSDNPRGLLLLGLRSNDRVANVQALPCFSSFILFRVIGVRAALVMIGRNHRQTAGLTGTCLHCSTTRLSTSLQCSDTVGWASGRASGP